MAYKPKVIRDKCIGAAPCVAIAPEVFDLDEENIAVIKKYKDVDDQTILMAAKSCPTQAIVVEDEKGKQIFP